MVFAFDQSQFMPRSGIANAATDVASPIVDLGYSQYQGFYNSTANWNVYRGCVLPLRAELGGGNTDTVQNPFRRSPETLGAPRGTGCQSRCRNFGHQRSAEMSAVAAGADVSSCGHLQSRRRVFSRQRLTAAAGPLDR